MISKKILFFVTIIVLSLFYIGTPVLANSSTKVDTKLASSSRFTKIREVDKGTFNEYGYHIFKDYTKLKRLFEVEKKMDSGILNNIRTNAKNGYNHLPSNISNENKYNELNISIDKGLKELNSEVAYIDLIRKIDIFLTTSQILELTGDISASPASGNAPFTVTLRGNVNDPTGSQILDRNYEWWIDDNGVRKVIGTGKSIDYTFNNEGNYVVFLDVKSSHRNEKKFLDILPFSKGVKVDVKSKLASLIFSINGKKINDETEIKFSPEISRYGLVFDATSSVPMKGTKFIKTERDFGIGSGGKKSYNTGPKKHIIKYANEGEYNIDLTITTNENNIIKKTFKLIIIDPAINIKSSKNSGNIGEKFEFEANNNSGRNNLVYSWKIIDIENDNILLEKKNVDKITYEFKNKGVYNVQLETKNTGGKMDSDSTLITIGSKGVVASFTSDISNKSFPNRVKLDGTKSYDLDEGNNSKLKFNWYVNNEYIEELEESSASGAIGYYTFNDLGEYTIKLEVENNDDKKAEKENKVSVKSLLSVLFETDPEVEQVGNSIKFIANSPLAKFYERDFGDRSKIERVDSNEIEHTFQTSGIFSPKLKVTDDNGNMNIFTKKVYIGKKDAPVAHIKIKLARNAEPVFDENECGSGAYIVDRVNQVNFLGGESINIDGTRNSLNYNWKLDNVFNNTIITGDNFSHKFNALGCFPVKLTVISKDNGKADFQEINVKVVNVKPELKGINVSLRELESDPLIIEVSALGAKDPDGYIQEYTWYYTTDDNPNPQEKRRTKVPKTTFVLPQISGKYNFVLEVEDNDNEKTSSLELKQYYEENGSSDKTIEEQDSLFVPGNNDYIPIVSLEVNKNSINVGDEVIFTAKANNISGEDITRDADFSWDFDGDGIYDKKTKEGKVSYKYEKSGNFSAKVKVRYKGMTNIKSVEINVVNMLEADFSYYPLKDKFLFFNKSKGKIDKVYWDMGDGNTIEAKDYLEYKYTDGKNEHTVSLKIQEGLKNLQKDIVVSGSDINNDNFSGSNDNFSGSNDNFSGSNDNFSGYFSYPEGINKKINLDEKIDKVVFYIEPKEGIQKYIADFDTEIDSSLNGTKDDDEDNKDKDSYINGGFIEVPLNDNKVQKVLLARVGDDNMVIDSEEYEIIKNYIEDTVDINSIKIDGLTEDENKKIEELKLLILSLDEGDKLKSVKSLQSLQEGWSDNFEKKSIITYFIDNLNSIQNDKDKPTVEKMISILESLEKGNPDNKARKIIEGIIPNDIPEYKNIISLLDKIDKNGKGEYENNKNIGKEIYTVLSKLVSDKKVSLDETDLQNIKNQLEEIIGISIDDDIDVIDSNDKKGYSKIYKILFGVILLIVLIGISFFVFKILKNKNVFSLPEKLKKDKKEVLPKDSNDGKVIDLLNEVENDTKKTDVIGLNENKGQTETVPDWLKTDTEAPLENEVKEELSKEAVKENIGKETETVPDWLKTDTEAPLENEVKEELSKEAVKENIGKETETVPDWLKTDTEAPLENEVKEELSKEAVKENIGKETETVPDWLKTDTEAPLENEVKEELPKEAVKENIGKETETVPDWLKTDTEAPLENEVKEELPKEALKENIGKETETVPDWLKTDTEVPLEELMKGKEKVKENIKEETEAMPDWLKEDTEGVQEDIPKEESPKKEEAFKENIKENIKEETEAMPDWLKEDTEGVQEDIPKEESPKKEEAFKENIKENIKEETEAMPDWLKEDKPVVKEEAPKKKISKKEEVPKNKESINKKVNKDTEKISKTKKIPKKNNNEEINNLKEEKIITTQEKKDDKNIPEWLIGINSITEDLKKDEQEESEETEENNTEDNSKKTSVKNNEENNNASKAKDDFWSLDDVINKKKNK